MTEDAEIARAKRRASDSAHAWAQFCAQFPTTGPIRQRLAMANAILATESPRSPAYAEAQHEAAALERQLGSEGRFSRDY